MARLVIFAHGTMGDFLPMLFLAQRLQARGHWVRMAVNPAFLERARAAGLEAVPCSERLGPEEVPGQAHNWDQWQRKSIAEMRQLVPRYNPESEFRDLEAACAGADLLITLPCISAGWLHEKHGLPWITVYLSPYWLQLSDPYAAPPRPVDPEKEAFQKEICCFANQIRRRLGLREYRHEEFGRSMAPVTCRLFLVPVSRHFSDLSGGRSLLPAHLTGFWFDPAHEPGWSPPAALAEFLSRGRPPLVLSLSSWPVTNPDRVVALHTEAATRLGLPLLILRGWAGLSRECWDGQGEVFFWPEYVPHAWLFPRAAAVFHHGGIGTTYQAMRAGVPMVVEPYGADQFFNASRVKALGVGVAMHPHKMTGASLAQVLAEKVLTPAYRQRAADLAERLRGDPDGLEVACTAIEEQLAGAANPRPDFSRASDSDFTAAPRIPG